MKLIVAGSRDVCDQEFIEDILDGIHQNRTITSVICGCARGPDTIGRVWAESRGVPIELFPANWEKHGSAAGPIRNAQMAEVADGLVAFWDGKSSGTRDMIKKMEKLNREVRVIVMPSNVALPEINTLDI